MAARDRLRPLAITVEEPQPGMYAWALLERHGSTWTMVDEARARAVRHTYREAMADGLVALQQRVEDLDAGPRMAAGTGDEGAAGEPRPEDTDAGRPPPRGRGGAGQPDGAARAAHRKRLFGFGPLV